MRSDGFPPSRRNAFGVPCPRSEDAPWPVRSPVMRLAGIRCFTDPLAGIGPSAEREVRDRRLSGRPTRRVTSRPGNVPSADIDTAPYSGTVNGSSGSRPARPRPSEPQYAAAPFPMPGLTSTGVESSARLAIDVRARETKKNRRLPLTGPSSRPSPRSSPGSGSAAWSRAGAGGRRPRTPSPPHRIDRRPQCLRGKARGMPDASAAIRRPDPLGHVQSRAPPPHGAEMKRPERPGRRRTPTEDVTRPEDSKPPSIAGR